MAGIYIHIPFCRQKCYYCDFYKTVNIAQTERYLHALKNEISFRKNYLQNENVQTIYFGGGTPTVLTGRQLEEIILLIKTQFQINNDVELTIEANPDDLSEDYIKQLTELGINRLSIGIQSFQDELLKKMNRRHSATQALNAIENAFRAGIKDISVDLIYGLPGLTIEKWKSDLAKTFNLPVTHLSAYHLTYHEGTPFYTWLKKGTLHDVEEKESVAQFRILTEMAEMNRFEHYEISNFAKNRMYSKHNTSYWTGAKYLGLGPSAHSYNQVTRSWNVAHTEKYISILEKGNLPAEEEILTDDNRYNEYVLTRIRTKWGVSSKVLAEKFGTKKEEYFKHHIFKYLETGIAVKNEEIYTLTKEGWFVSDEIMANLMFI